MIISSIICILIELFTRGFEKINNPTLVVVCVLLLSALIMLIISQRYFLKLGMRHGKPLGFFSELLAGAMLDAIQSNSYIVDLNETKQDEKQKSEIKFFEDLRI